jgi:hypothetical protein
VCGVEDLGYFADARARAGYYVDPSLLENVIAMSSSDSIYIGGALPLDPQEQAYSGDIRRDLGNIGKPGIAFLVPLVDPIIQEVKMSD